MQPRIGEVGDAEENLGWYEGKVETGDLEMQVWRSPSPPVPGAVAALARCVNEWTE